MFCEKKTFLTPFFTAFVADCDAPTIAKYEMTFFVFSVLPAPDSPVMSIDWFSLSARIFLSVFCCKTFADFSKSPTFHHVSVRLVTGGEQMWRHFVAAFAHEHCRHRVRVDGQTFVRVDDDYEQARVGLSGSGFIRILNLQFPTFAIFDFFLMLIDLVQI
jgi:hypothetical protein